MNRVTKEIAIALKEIGYDVPCDAYYFEGGNDTPNIHPKKVDYNKATSVMSEILGDLISAPTVYEAIEWLDSKGVYVCVEIAVDGWRAVVFENQGVDLDVIDILGALPTRLAAYTSGLPIAINHIKNKKV